MFVREPRIILILTTPGTNSSENQTTTVGKNQTTALRKLTAKNVSETQTTAVAKATVTNAAENPTAVWIQTTSTVSAVPNVSHITNTFVSTTRPMIENVQTSVNSRKSKTRHRLQLTKRNHGRRFLHLEPIVVFREPIHKRRQTKLLLTLPLPKPVWSTMTISLSPRLPFHQSHPRSNP